MNFLGYNLTFTLTFINNNQLRRFHPFECINFDHFFFQIQQNICFWDLRPILYKILQKLHTFLSSCQPACDCKIINMDGWWIIRAKFSPFSLLLPWFYSLHLGQKQSSPNVLTRSHAFDWSYRVFPMGLLSRITLRLSHTRRIHSSPHVPFTFTDVLCMFLSARDSKICNTVVDWRASSRDRSHRSADVSICWGEQCEGEEKVEGWGDPNPDQKSLVLFWCRCHHNVGKLIDVLLEKCADSRGFLEVAVRSVYFCGVVT